jgi:uncharacterized repeat protein (TIGR02543 family)/LPXTG-motif cell wall-anchored protein
LIFNKEDFMVKKHHSVYSRLLQIVGIVLSLLMVLFAGPAANVQAATTILRPNLVDAQNTFISSSFPDFNYSNNGLINIGESTQFNNIDYGLIRFDISSLPDTVDRVVLQLVLVTSYNPLDQGPNTITAHQMLTAWDADAVTWNTPLTYENTPAASCLGAAASESVWEWDITTLYRAWKAGTANYGLYLKSDNVPSPATHGFVACHNESPPDLWPRLVVDYGLTVTRTVTFDSRGGSTVPAVQVNDGGLVPEPADPSRTGFVFERWTRDEAGSLIWDFAVSTVTEDITLYAQWTEEPAPTTDETTALPSQTTDSQPTGEDIPTTGESGASVYLGFGLLLTAGLAGLYGYRRRRT